MVAGTTLRLQGSKADMKGIVLKPLSEQTLVITGATSGNGLATALAAAAAGAAVVLVARNEPALRMVQDRIIVNGGRAAIVVADVGDPAQVDAIVARARTAFGGFNTWINNAGVGIYAPLVDTPLADHMRLFQTNYWGVVHGSLAAVRHFRSRPGGGALINVGSIQSDMAAPLLGAYTASKHAVKGFTDALRIELRREGVPVSVTLIKPSAIGTPFPQNGRNLTGFKARLPRPLYAPTVVADAILLAAQTPRRTITVGGVGRAQVILATTLPELYDRLAPITVPWLVDRSHPVGPVEGNLDAPQQGYEPAIEGDQRGRPFSLYTQSHARPGIAGATLIAGLLMAAGLAVSLTGRNWERTAADG